VFTLSFHFHSHSYHLSSRRTWVYLFSSYFAHLKDLNRRNFTLSTVPFVLCVISKCSSFNRSSFWHVQPLLSKFWRAMAPNRRGGVSPNSQTQPPGSLSATAVSLDLSRLNLKPLRHFPRKAPNWLTGTRSPVDRLGLNSGAESRQILHWWTFDAHMLY
jgi:hypothetical protein